jgi:hypothetical protein
VTKDHVAQRERREPARRAALIDQICAIHQAFRHGTIGAPFSSTFPAKAVSRLEHYSPL